MSVVKKSASGALSNVTELRERVAAPSRRETEWSANDLVTSDQMASATMQFRLARNMISTPSKEPVIAVQLKTLIIDLRGNIAFLEAANEGVKVESAKVTAESTRFGALFDGVRGQVVELQKSQVQKKPQSDQLIRLHARRSGRQLRNLLRASAWDIINLCAMLFDLATLTHKSLLILPLMLSLFIFWKVRLLKSLRGLQKGKKLYL